MSEKSQFLKSILYIALQLVSLWGIFLLLTDTVSPSKEEITGVVILTLIFFIYANKNIKVLKSCDLNIKEKSLLAI